MLKSINKIQFFLRNLFILMLILLLSGYSFTQEISNDFLKEITSEQADAIKQKFSDTSDENFRLFDETTEESLKDNSSISDPNLSSSKKFGYDFFSSAPTSTIATGDLPFPNEYKISLKDQLTIFLSGTRNSKFDVNVNLDGTILIPEIGSVFAVGKTFGELKEVISNLVANSYVGTSVNVSLKNLSAKKITIVGAVQTPGTYLVNPFSTISSSLAYSGGISEVGTLRKIKLIRSNGDIFYFDLYQLLINGDRSGDLTIESGDVILINPAEKFVLLTGAIKRNATYEILPNENLNDLISFGLGFEETSNKTNINLSIFDPESTLYVEKNVSDLSVNLKNVVSVDVQNYVTKGSFNINVTGAVKEPGFYELSSNENLENLIENLKFVNVYPWLAVLEQFDENNLIKTSFIFSLKDPDSYKSIKLLPNSKVYFANIFNREFEVSEESQTLINDYQLILSHKQGDFNLPVIGKFSVKEFIDLLGLDMSDVNKEATYISPLEDIVIKDNYQNMSFTAKKYNTVSFRSQVNDLIQVNVSGAVDFPGLYSLESNSTLEDLYDLIGRFKPEAFTNGIVFTRESVREQQLKSIEKSKRDLNEAIIVSNQKGDNIVDMNIIEALSQSIDSENLGRIAGDFSPESERINKMGLRNGDAIFVPKNPNTINVLGEVLNPISFEFSKRETVYSAISAAGGFRDFADKNKIYVIKANGLVKKQKRSNTLKVFSLGIFPRNLRLEPGDTIIVPRKIIVNNPGIDFLIPVTQVLSDLAFSAAAIDSLRD